MTEGTQVRTARILVVDDQQAWRTQIARILSDCGDVEILQAGNAEDAVSLFRQARPDLTLLDLRLPEGKEGLGLLKEFRAIDRERPIVMITACGTTKAAVEAMQVGATDFIDKSPEFRSSPDSS